MHYANSRSHIQGVRHVT